MCFLKKATGVTRYKNVNSVPKYQDLWL